MPRTVLVTGAAGFVGGHLLDLLTSGVANPANLVAWHRPGHSPSLGKSDVTWEPVDLVDRQRVAEAIDRLRPDVVYHCGGEAHVAHAWSRTESTFSANVLGTHHLIDALARAGTSARVLIPSSSLVYQPADRALTENDPLIPANPYGLSKLAQEMVAMHSMSPRTAILIARAFTHIGPRQSSSFSASGFARQIADIEAGRQAPEIHVGNLDARRDLTDVRDTIRAYQAIVERGQPGRPYNVGSGHAVRIGDVLQDLLARAQVQIKVIVDPEKLRPSDAPIVVGDTARVHTEIGWSPRIPLAQTLDEILDYWRRQVDGEPATKSQGI